MVDLITKFARTFLRTKTSGDVVGADLNNREIIFSNDQKSIFVKDSNGNLYRFIRVDDSEETSSNTWSAEKIKNYIDSRIP